MTRKSDPVSTRGPEDSQQPLSPAGCLIQFASGFGGFAVLVLVWVTILREPSWHFTFRDFLFWGAAFGMIAARQVGQGRYDDRGPHGEASKAWGVWRFALTLLSIAGLLWCFGHATHV